MLSATSGCHLNPTPKRNYGNLKSSVFYGTLKSFLTRGGIYGVCFSKFSCLPQAKLYNLNVSRWRLISRTEKDKLWNVLRNQWANEHDEDVKILFLLCYKFRSTQRALSWLQCLIFNLEDLLSAAPTNLPWRSKNNFEIEKVVKRSVSHPGYPVCARKLLLSWT